MKILTLGTGLAAVLLLAQQQPSADPTIRVNVNLIQVDVTVTGKGGVRVPGLTAEDFELFQDGRKQKITSALWVGRSRDGSNALPAVGETPASPSSAPRGPQPTRQQIRRTVAIFLDDLSIEPANLAYAKEAVTKFIETSIEPGDLVAIFRSSSSMGMLQQFTTDRRQLLSALGRISFRSLNQTNPLAAVDRDPNENASDPTIAQMALEQRLRDEISRRERQDMITAGMLGSLQHLASGMRELPGRKSIVLFSESVQLIDAPQSLFNPDMTAGMQLIPGAQGGSRYRTVNALRNLTDLANRAGVVLYAIDPRGLQTLGFTAQDKPPGNARQATAVLNQRSFEYTTSQAGMGVMAESTGGLFYKNTNDLGTALRDALADQEDYYLLSFVPDDQTFEKVRGTTKMHQIEVKLKRSGLRVRYRKGYLGVPDSERFPNQNQPLMAALMSPFRATDLPVRLTPLFRQVEVEDDKKKGATTPRAVIRTMLHFDPSQLTYVPQPAEASDKDQTPWQTSKIELALYLFDEENKVVTSNARAQGIRLRGVGRDSVMKSGLVVELDLAIAKPGGYQLRAAIRDPASGLTGSGAQFLVIPDLAKRQLVTSDLVLASADWESGKAPRGSPAQRVFAPGETITYNMVIYNAQTDAATQSPRLDTQILLYRDGRIVYWGALRPVANPNHRKDAPLVLSGNLTLGRTSAPGDYAFEISVRDNLAPKKQQFSVRSQDFAVAAAQ